MGIFLKDGSLGQVISSDPTDCFGNFNRGDKVCMKWCAMRLACCIEYDRQMEDEYIMEDDLQPMGSMIMN
ncbi:hypothetical protein [Desulfatibacillum aliphaticivorans]|uniref:Uncharacterized protein n=1 Tax=Desulfatibacillum aliphaticivorans TaxID=218208 RepID=B8F9K4_DESAL|nr:hypothetical protein [Desulfatibacillum aliphaticivorans]ACL02950.1 hypothetical protein Dalk_1247 [Desulfatibacillum aliphaticivorans]